MRPLTVLHQLVVGRQDARYPPLHRQRGNLNFHLLQHRLGNKRLRCASGVSAQFGVMQKVEQKLRVELITRWKRDERIIRSPELFGTVCHRAAVSAHSPNDDAILIAILVAAADNSVRPVNRIAAFTTRLDCLAVSKANHVAKLHCSCGGSHRHASRISATFDALHRTLTPTLSHKEREKPAMVCSRSRACCAPSSPALLPRCAPSPWPLPAGEESGEWSKWATVKESL